MRAALGLTEIGTDTVTERAVAMLAGRVGCRLAEARGHLIRIAGEHGRDVHEVAAELLIVLESQACPGDAERAARTMVDRAARSMADQSSEAGPPPHEPSPGGAGWPNAAAPEWIQHFLDTVSGEYAWLLPVRDAAGAVRDFSIEAASPDAVDVRGRHGVALVGLSVRQAYPYTVDGPVWRAYLDVLADGAPREIGPVEFGEAPNDTGRPSFSIRVHAVRGGLMVSWVRRDAAARDRERLAQTERLARLGWGEWDLVTGEVTWSDELYRIYERDPALGPLSLTESSALVLDSDQSVRAESAAVLARGQTADVTYRILVCGRVKHVRVVVDAVRDSAGKPLRLYGIVQDVTSREIARVRLAAVERELREHRQTLAAEHRLAAQLQHIVLPIPAAPIDLPGLRVAVRYLPAERASRVGGDWYHAAVDPDGQVLLAIGDVAGHGLQAATMMAQLRHAMAALAITTTTDPAALLSHLNRLLCASDSGIGTATAVIARYDPSTGMLTWAQAGHPAPLRTRAGVTTSLPRPRGPLLGAARDARYDLATVQVHQEDLLVFYTDGLIEDRKRSLEEGLAPVIATLNEISARATPTPLAELLERLTRANPDDDTCVLAVRLYGGPAREYSADASTEDVAAEGVAAEDVAADHAADHMAPDGVAARGATAGA